MKVCALLSWYDEDPRWLDRCVRSLAWLPVDRVVAVDGAYALYPGGKAASPPDQPEAIRRACLGIGAQCTLHLPDEVWAGNEVEKRNRLFELGERFTSEGDWWFVVDADEHVLYAPADLRDRLQRAPFDVGAVELVEPGGPTGTITFPTHPKFFRAIRGLRCHQDHFTYRTPDGRNLWGDAKRTRLEPRADLSGVRVEHRKEFRHPDRRAAANGYYRARDAAGVEELPVDRSVLAA